MAEVLSVEVVIQPKSELNKNQNWFLEPLCDYVLNLAYLLFSLFSKI